MNPSIGADCEQIDQLLSGFLDEELTQGQAQRVRVHLDTCERCSSRLKELRKVRAAVGGIQLEKMAKEEWSSAMNDLSVKTTRSLGWLLVVGGVLAAFGYIGYEVILAETDVPLIKWGFVAFYLGFGVLLLSVLRQRLIARKTDRYKDVEN